MTLNFWRTVSNISAYSCGGVAITNTFFKKYISSEYAPVIIWLLAITILLFFIAELMKMSIKRSS